MANPVTIALLAAATVAAFLVMVARQLPVSASSVSRRLSNALAAPSQAQDQTEYEFGTQEFKASLLLRRLHIRVQVGEEVRTIGMIRIVLAIAGAGIALVFGLPLVVLAALGGVIWFGVGLLLDAQVGSVKASIEKSTAKVFSDVAALAMINADASTILERTSTNLRAAGDRYLAPELERVERDLRLRGRQALLDAEARVQNISPSLALFFFILRRLQETGGAQFSSAFQSAANNLGAIMSVRQKIQAKADGAHGTIRIIVGAFIFVFAQMFLNPLMRQTYTSLPAQMMLAGCIGAMAFGYWFISGQIEEVL
ncbi:MAG: hypothetical protein JW850_12845 [Thermoflexales bacterium]|nr:hypothetical protein [Thermoflexales bacterium]